MDFLSLSQFFSRFGARGFWKLAWGKEKVSFLSQKVEIGWPLWCSDDPMGDDLIGVCRGSSVQKDFKVRQAA